MSVSTAGIELRQGSQRLRAAVELLSSMRFAISLLTVICIASVIGTVLRQHEPAGNYINQFGPFWFEVFQSLSLYTVYSAWWFLLILAFLVLSTSLCIIRNTPKIVHDLRLFKENIREQSLRAFPQHAEQGWAEAPEAAAHRLGAALAGMGWKVRLQRRSTAQGEGWMVAAKAGALNKLGYLAAHGAIVLICLGGLLDGDLVVRAQMWWGGKTPYDGSGLMSAVPPEHRLGQGNPTFRGNLFVAEGGRSGTAVLAQPDGVVLQDLPFEVELKKFVVDYYSTGMPKLFASDIVIHDRQDGSRTEARVEVNHPVNHKGVEIYQASFDDGGSLLKLHAQPMADGERPFDLAARVGESVSLSRDAEQLRVEVTGLRVINVENFRTPAQGSDLRGVNLGQEISSRMGAAHKSDGGKNLRNVGPSFTYKLRDASGQAREFHNYMVPIDMDGTRVMVMGVRDNPSDTFRYLRVPVDERDSIDGFFRLRQALSDAALRRQAVDRYVRQAAAGQRPEMVQALRVSAQRAIDLFAGTDPAIASLPHNDLPVLAGLQAVSAFMEQNVPEAERDKAVDVLLRIMNGTLFELYQLSREAAGQSAAPRDDATTAFMTQAVFTLSDAVFYPAPFVLQMTGFDQVQASVFQVARAPGKSVVYLGCLLLILGVFAMLYVRERRLWVWLAPVADGRLHATMALSSNRKMLDNETAFERLKARLFPSVSDEVKK